MRNKQKNERTLNDEKHVGEENSVYLKLGSGRRCLLNKDFVGDTFNGQKYRMLKEFVYLSLGSGRRCLMNKGIVMNKDME